MTARKVRQVLLSIFFGALIGAGLMGIAVIRSPHSHADVSLTPYSRDWIATGGGQAVCMWFKDKGMTAETIGAIFSAVEKVTSTNDSESAGIIVESIHSYCPQYWNTMTAIVNEASAGKIKLGTVV